MDADHQGGRRRRGVTERPASCPEARALPVAIEQTALRKTSVYINGGQRGLQIEIDPNDARRVLGAIVAALVME